MSKSELAKLDQSILSRIENTVSWIPQGSSVFVGVSGGVDSAVTAIILHLLGYKVTAVYMKCYDNIAECNAEKDYSDAIKSLSPYGLQVLSWDFQEEYQEKVLDSFYKDYSKGLTPNPDILCNSEIKFGVFIEKVLKTNPDAFIATGHYSLNLSRDDIQDIDDELLRKFSDRLLCAGFDSAKDQSYFLYRLAASTDKLNRVVFPLGSLVKQEVRSLAHSVSLIVADKQDSQGICFVGSVKIRDFLRNHVTGSAGPVISLNGDVIGSHNGLNTITIGQRHGFTIDRPEHGPYYVVDKLLDDNTLVVGGRNDVMASEFVIDSASFIISDPERLKNITVRIRHLGELIPCSISGLGVGGERKVLTGKPIFAVAPGQSAVFYLNNIVVGGGVIKSVRTKYKEGGPH